MLCCRRQLFFIAVFAMAPGNAVVRADDPASGLDRMIEVPLDYANPMGGRATLTYEFGAKFDPAKPTVVLIADGQQFYLRKGLVARQQATFGEGFNVVGIIGRGNTEAFIKAATGLDGRPDWTKAWRIFNSGQWIEDIDSVRRTLLGESGKLLLFGQSGGAMLVHEYLAKHGDHVQRAFTAAAVNPYLERELGLFHDRFWDEIGAHDRALQNRLRDALKQHPDDRPRMIMTMQRQNFFVSPERLQQARAELIGVLASGDKTRYDEARKTYQVEEVMKFFESPDGMPTRVREFEFFYPLHAGMRLSDAEVHPDLENTFNFAKPLVELCEAGKIPPPSWNAAALHRLDAEVFVLAGGVDHAVDYRTSIALTSLYPRHYLFLANDDHMFGKLRASKDYESLIQAFLRFGLDSPELRKALASAEPNRWNGVEKLTKAPVNASARD